MAKRTQKERSDDLGFGTKVNEVRLINPDGSFNVIRTGISTFRIRGIYHYLINMSWTRFWLIILAGYFIMNLIFALIYLIIGVDHLQGVMEKDGTGYFLESFFFSAQTFTTVGYGRLNPVGFAANFVAAIESMLGLMTFALATGLLYGRFAKPEARILFSSQAIIAPYLGISAFEFRMANQREYQLIDVEARLNMSRIEEVNGELKRQFYQLNLERNMINFFPSTWTIVHPITEDSPIYDWSLDKIREAKSEFLVLVKAFDDTFSQTVHARTSYLAEEIVSGALFVNILQPNGEGKNLLDLSRLDEIRPATLPVEPS